MYDASSGRLHETIRPWVSLWITIHFFAIGLALVANIGSSDLERRLLRVLSPYLNGLHQDYGNVPLEMTSGTSTDFKHELQVHQSTAAAHVWNNVAPSENVLSIVDRRWNGFERLLSSAVEDKSEELIHLIFEQTIAHASGNGVADIDRIRVARTATLSLERDIALRTGELNESEPEDQSFFECRVVSLSPGRVKLIPILESTRTTKSLSGSSKNKTNQAMSASDEQQNKERTR